MTDPAQNDNASVNPNNVNNANRAKTTQLSSQQDKYELKDLLELMRTLRSEDEGCPWDVEQSWDSIVPHTLEEAYEVADAIHRRAFDEVRSELGDLLFQVVYYAQFADEEGRFDFSDVIDGLVAKMVARHPHVFPEGTLASRRHHQPARSLTQSDVNNAWEAKKSQERDERSASNTSSLMDDIPLALPALNRAAKLGKRAARLGFDWPDHEGAKSKVEEELAEVDEAVRLKTSQDVEEELGDLLFATACYCRKLGVDPEHALNQANRKFERRFRGVEALYQEGDDLDTLEHYWQQVKRQEKG